MAAVEFFYEDIDFKVPKPTKTRKWVRLVIEREEKSLSHLNYIFCSDEYLHSLNQQYLNHDTLTDIITFDQSETPDQIEGDIFISVDRVRQNANDLGIPFAHELDRVIVHGILHLLGYRDKSAAEKEVMREKEDAYLSLRDGA